MRTTMLVAGAAALIMTGCNKEKAGACCGTGHSAGAVKLITLDPGHFHAALIQRQMYPEVAGTVHVYAPEGGDLDLHMGRIEGFNKRAESPTAWESKIYTGADFLERALSDKAGNVVVLAGNNGRKTEYILKCVEAGYNVLADKPMAITPKDFELLKRAFTVAEEKGVLLYDIMTERYEITTMMQRELSRFPELYGEQEKGSPDDPAVTKESVHHFMKTVAGNPLQRPPWYYDTDQQGEAIVDVNTHLTDLIQWETFPDVTLNPSDIEVVSARTWVTPVTLEEFGKSTSMSEWPEYLKPRLDGDGVLQCNANGEFTYAIKGVYAKASVMWNYEAPEGGGDTHFSLMRGTRCSLIIEQGEAEGYKPVLYVEPRRNTGVKFEDVEAALKGAIAEVNKKWPGVGFERFETGFRINIPAKYATSHEEHFGEVAEKYLNFLKSGKMPEWEVPNMIVKYHTLMEAYKKSR